MSIQNWSENVILVNFFREPEMGEELEIITEMFRYKPDRDIVIDFSAADIITSSSLSKLLRLQKMVKDSNHNLILCGLAPFTKSIFKVTGLLDVFEFVEDKITALAGLQPLLSP